MAFRLFCLPRGGRGPVPMDGVFGHCNRSKAHYENHDIQTYEWIGSGPTVLLVHGFHSNSYRWRALVGRLIKEDYRVVAFDAPGHGDSSGKLLNAPLYARVLHQVMQAQQPDFVIGHSIGGIAICLQAHLNPGNGAQRGTVLLGTPSKLRYLTNDFKKILDLSDRVIQNLDEYVKVETGFTIDSFDAAAFAKAISTPTLLVHAQDDRLIPVRDGREIAAANPEFTYLEYEEGGHSLLNSRTYRDVMQFLQSLGKD